MSRKLWLVLGLVVVLAGSWTVFTEFSPTSSSTGSSNQGSISSQQNAGTGATQAGTPGAAEGSQSTGLDQGPAQHPSAPGAVPGAPRPGSTHPGLPASSQASLPGASLQWPSFGNNPWQDRFSPDTSLTPHSVNGLKTAYDLPLPGDKGSSETFPLEAGGTLYVTTSNAVVVAVNATSGKIQWTYKPKVNWQQGMPHINRGVALGAGRVFVLTADDHLVALDRTSGKLVWRKQVADASAGYFETMAPLVAGSAVVVGSSGGDEGNRGFVAAYGANSGSKLWQFYTVPERGQGWLPKDGNHGGGAVWTTPAYDPSSGRLFAGTGNPSPDYFGKARPGPDPYTDSLLALDATAGDLDWYQQEVPHDLWDYDLASPPVLFTVNGQLVVGEAGKDGFWYEWNAASGKPVIKPVAFVKEDHSPPTAQGTREWPGPDGGANYGPSAYDPRLHLVFVAGINGAEILYSKPSTHHGHGPDLGTAQGGTPASEWTGTITAIDVRTGTVAWQVKTKTPPIGGLTANAGGLVWFGTAGGKLEALSAQTGATAWRADLGVPVGSAPVIYSRGGQAFLTIATGGAQSMINLFPWHGQDHLITYTLPSGSQ